jgi:hypothetical protein
VIYRSYILKAPPDAEGIETLISRISTALASRKENLRTTYSYAGFDKDKRAHIWQEVPSLNSEISLKEDRIADGFHLMLAASTEAACDRLEGALAGALVFWTVEELAEKARGCPQSDRTWIEWMALAVNRQKNDVVRSVIEEQLESSSTKCRSSAAIAAGLLRWPELLPSLTSRLAVENDAGIRSMLRFVIEHTQKPAGGSRSKARGKR